MKLNNIQVPFITILLCSALSKGTARSSIDPSSLLNNNAYPPEASQFSDSEPPFSSPASSEAPSYQGSGHSFSSSFKDFLKGSFRGSLTMPHDLNSEPIQNHALEQICVHTDFPDVCFSTISPLIKSNTFDVINVLEASIKACSEQIKLTMNVALKHAPPEVATVISECRDQYGDALENLQRALDSIASRDLGTVTIMLSAVVADVSTCESELEDVKQHAVVSDFDGSVSIMASNCLSIASLVPF